VPTPPACFSPSIPNPNHGNPDRFVKNGGLAEFRRTPSTASARPVLVLGSVK